GLRRRSHVGHRCVSRATAPPPPGAGAAGAVHPLAASARGRRGVPSERESCASTGRMPACALSRGGVCWLSATACHCAARPRRTAARAGDETGRDTCDERAARGRRARERPGAGDRPVRDSADAELRGAGGPGAPALLGLDLLGDVDLLGAAGLIGGGGVLAAAEGPAGLTRELQAAVVAVAGVDRPVAAGLALRDAVPDGTRRGGRCRGAAVLRGGRVLGAALGAAVGRARAGALLGLLLALLLGLGRLGRGLRSGLRLLLGALGDDLADRLGDDVLGDDLGLGDLAVDDGLGVDELLGAGLALGGGLG